MTNKIILKTTENHHLISFIIQKKFFLKVPTLCQVLMAVLESVAPSTLTLSKGATLVFNVLQNLMVPLWHHNVRAETKKDDILKRT